MDKFGIDNVRGGSFVTVKLDKSIINCLKLMNNNLNNKTLQLLDVYINMEKTKPTQYNYFTDIFTFIAKLLKPTK